MFVTTVKLGYNELGFNEQIKKLDGLGHFYNDLG